MKSNKKNKKKKKKKGFTLIELLAVIVILGLLMAIAIPSVTKYITESRKKTVATTIGNYISTLINDVNNMEYIFTETNTVYAVPIECISLERGGTNPFGKWHQANNAYWAYVLVQYDDAASSYTYGFTFKDSAGYGLFPITIEKLNEGGKQIQTGLDLTRPTTGKITNITEKANWTGFDVETDTNLVVLEAESEGNTGDGKKTCTLRQKGDNYEEIENEKLTRPRGRLNDLIKTDNVVINEAPTLTNSINKTSDKSGLYISTATNNGQQTHYFRGKVENNYVQFANMIWKIIRINEDGTIRIILDNKINATDYTFNSLASEFSNMYYSNSDIKPIINSWYNDNLKKYDSYIANNTFCEEARVTYNNQWLGGDANLALSKNYTPNFKCGTDGNNKGPITSKIGLITYDEAVFAGAYYGNTNTSCYLYTGSYDIWTITPAGKNSTGAGVWFIKSTGALYDTYVTKTRGISPVINLNTDTKVTGMGTSDNPYVVVVE